MLLKSCLLLASAIITLSHSQDPALGIVVTQARLPSGREHMPAVYDGDDSIYILGGYGYSRRYNTILRYSIASDSITDVGSLSVALEDGAAVWVGNSTLLYLGGQSGSTTAEAIIYRVRTNYEPLDITTMTGLPVRLYGLSAVWDPEQERAYTFGGWATGTNPVRDVVVKHDVKLNISEQVGQLPSPRHWTSAVWNGQNHKAYVFGGSDNNGWLVARDILEFDSITQTTTTLITRLPVTTANSCAIWTGTEAYVLSGSRDVQRFNPATNEIQNYTTTASYPGLGSGSCAYVDRLNRVYMFGGYYFNGQNQYSDQVIFMQL